MSRIRAREKSLTHQVTAEEPGEYKVCVAKTKASTHVSLWVEKPDADRTTEVVIELTKDPASGQLLGIEATELDWPDIGLPEERGYDSSTPGNIPPDSSSPHVLPLGEIAGYLKFAQRVTQS
jgi:hypothetical protein